MFIKRFILRTAGTSLAATICLSVQSLTAQTSSEPKAIEELKRQVAELQKEVASLRQHAGPAPAATAEGKTKTVVSTDGKTYTEKLVPDLGGSKWKLSSAITELESSVMHVSDTNTVGADFQVMIELIQTIGMSANVNVIACAWDCAAHCLTIVFWSAIGNQHQPALDKRDLR